MPGPYTHRTNWTDNNPADRYNAQAANQVGEDLNTLNNSVPLKYVKPGTGIPEADLSTGVQTKLNAVGGGGSSRKFEDLIVGGPRGVLPSGVLTVNSLLTAAPSYSGSKTFNWSTDASRFRFGGKMGSNTTSSITCGVNVCQGADTDNSYIWTSYEVEFWTLGPDCTIIFRNFNNMDYLILIDDFMIAPQWLNFTSSTGLRYHQLRFADGMPHRIRILNGANGFVGVMTPSSGDIFAAAPRPQIGMTGDSYLQGAATASEPGPVMGGGICGQFALATGMEVINFGQGTTGYIDDGGGTGGRSEYGSAERMAAYNYFASTLQAMVVFGGGNDTSETPSAVAAAANTMWSAVKAQHPNAALIVVGIQTPDLFPFPSGNMQAIDNALAAAAAANADVDLFISMRTPSYWVTDVTKDLFITYEALASIHPGKAGSDNIVQRMLNKMRGLTW